MKTMDKTGAFLMDNNFSQHQRDCEICQGYDGTNATLHKLCLEGGVLIKRDAPKQKREKKERDPYKTTKDNLASLMKYK